MTDCSRDSDNGPVSPRSANSFEDPQKDIKKLEEAVTTHVKEITQMRSKLSERESHVSTLYDKIQTLQKDLTEKEKHMALLQEQVGVLKEQEWLAQRATARMETEINSSRVYAVRVSELMDESAKTTEQMKKNALELEATRRRCNHYRLAIEGMERELRAARQLSGEIQTLEDEVKTLKAIGVVKERDNMQMKNALHMLEAWFSDYDKMERTDFAEVKRRAIDGVTYPEGVVPSSNKYDQFFIRER